MIEKMLEGIEVKLNTNFFDNKNKWMNIADKILFTGMIDEYYDYCYGELEYRGLNFEFEVLDIENYQGNAVINYTDAETPYTRIIEHKHFENFIDFNVTAFQIIKNNYHKRISKKMDKR